MSKANINSYFQNKLKERNTMIVTIIGGMGYLG